MKPTILLVDNRRTFLDTQARLLEMEAYHVYRAESVTQARQILDHKWVHLAIVDVRLEDDDDPHDRSGIILAEKPEYKGIPKIILTAYPSYQDAVDAIGSLEKIPSAIDYIGKDRGSDFLIQRVKAAFENSIHINWTLGIKTQEPINLFGLVHSIEPGLDKNSFGERAEELEDLLRCVFFSAKHIKLEQMLWKSACRVAMEVYAFHENAPVETYLLVCGLFNPVSEEKERFERFAPEIAAPNGTTLVHDAHTTHYGATLYKLNNNELDTTQSLAEFYQTRPEKELLAAIDLLFKETLPVWFKGKPFRGKLALGAWCLAALGLSPEHCTPANLEQKMSTIARQVAIPGLVFTCENGALIVHYGQQQYRYEHAVPELATVLSEAPQTLLLVNGPGTINGSNVMVEARGQTWLTDFYKAGEQPLFWNYAALEAAMRFDWPEPAPLQDVHQFERCLSEGAFTHPDLRDLPAELRKPGRAIDALRSLAQEPVGEDTSLYILALLIQAIRRLCDYDTNVPLIPKELTRYAHLVLAIAMLNQTLTANTHPQLKSRPSGLEMDRPNHRVTIDHLPVPLSGREYRLFSYLYEHANRLCERGKLFEYGFQSIYQPFENDRFHQTISRLRRKLAEFGTAWGDIETVEGEGYRLILRNQG